MWEYYKEKQEKQIEEEVVEEGENKEKEKNAMRKL